LMVYDANETGDKKWRWVVADQLGSPRMNVDKTGTLAGMTRHDYLPFGEEIGAGVGIRSTTTGYTADTVRQKFGSKERDTETGLDYFGFRYHSSMQGRFTSPDRPLVDQWEDDPQSWNLYSYVTNNPLKYVDPYGLWKRLTNSDGREIWIAEEGDTLTSLAKIVGVSTKSLVGFFDGVTNVQIGVGYDVTALQRKTARQMEAEVDAAREREQYLENSLRDMRWKLWQLEHEVRDEEMRRNTREASVPTPTKGFWIARELFRQLVLKVGLGNANKFKAALKNGIVAPTGKSGIKILDAKVGKYTHELKIGGSADRILGYVNEQGVLIFDKLVKGELH
jgi:RHS repeat-associated protein